MVELYRMACESLGYLGRSRSRLGHCGKGCGQKMSRKLAWNPEETGSHYWMEREASYRRPESDTSVQ